MTTSFKVAISAILAAVITMAIYGAYQYPKSVVQFGSPTGATFNDAKVASINMALATAGTNATSSTITNTDGSDRIITGDFVSCNGLGSSLSGGGATGLANLILSIATTTGNSAVGLVTVATTSPQINVASSTTNGAASWQARWGAGTTLTFSWNATNTAACLVGVNYLAS